MDQKFTILQINNFDIGGGAEIVAMNLFPGYLLRGYRSYYLVGLKRGSNPYIREIEMGHSQSPWEKFWLTKAGKYKHTKDLSKISWIKYYCTKFLANPIGTLCLLSGTPDYNFPATWDITNLIPETPDILHLHNLHGDYFDLRALPDICKKTPVVITIHDLWILGQFYKNPADPLFFQDPLSSNNAVPTFFRDISKKIQHKDYQNAAEIFRNCRLYVVTPSKWMMNLALRSILKPAIVKSAVIPNGVDQSVFKPYNRIKAREELGLPLQGNILVTAASHICQNPTKDYNTLHRALSLIAEQMPEIKIIFYVIGDTSTTESLRNIEIRFVPFVLDTLKMAKYYQAADIYIHATRVDNFPTAIIEALSCGTPVIATSVGGIPEQVIDGDNGFLVRIGDPADMAEKIKQLIKNPAQREKMSQNAINEAKERYNLEMQIDAYLAFYEKILVNKD